MPSSAEQNLAVDLKQKKILDLDRTWPNCINSARLPNTQLQKSLANLAQPFLSPNFDVACDVVVDDVPWAKHKSEKCPTF